MKNWLKVLLGLFVLLLFIIQIPAFTPEKNYTDAEPVHDIATAYDVPMDVLMHLYDGCYDCHSNYTEEYPWYYHVQPVSWWMNHHIKKAKEELNFSEFAAYPPQKAAKKFHEIEEVMEDHSMPLKSFLLLHEEARLSDSDYKDVAAWAKQMQEELKAKEGASTTP